MPKNAPMAFLGHGLMRSLRLVPYLRSFLEELEIKPKNNFKRGLFMPVVRGRRLRRGGLFPQGLVRTQNGSIGLSDDSLGDNLTLVGFGIDPCTQLDEEIRHCWEGCGGRYLHVGLQGQKSRATTPFIEDLNYALLGKAPVGSLAVVRPDRIVMHEGPHTQAGKLIRESLALLGY
jgi:3-(3-hydroxy-phenyl)propionate hydroxylase